MSVTSVEDVEGGATDPKPKTIDALRTALEMAGVLPLDVGDMRQGGSGVRLREGEW